MNNRRILPRRMALSTFLYYYSFDPKTLKIATTEQLGAIMEEESVFRDTYMQEERKYRCNAGRTMYNTEWGVDFFIGEVVFDGKRWHLLLVIGLVVALLSSWAAIFYVKYFRLPATAASEVKIRQATTVRRVVSIGSSDMKTD